MNWVTSLLLKDNAGMFLRCLLQFRTVLGSKFASRVEVQPLEELGYMYDKSEKSLVVRSTKSLSKVNKRTHGSYLCVDRFRSISARFRYLV